MSAERLVNVVIVSRPESGSERAAKLLSPIDPVAFAVAVLILVMAMLVAALRPAARAARLDPMASMRN